MSLYRATHSFVYGSRTGDQWVHGGTVHDENDPLVKAFPDFFELVVEPAPQQPAPGRRRRNG